MRIWLIKSSELTPIDGDNPRLFRMGVLAKHLVAKGHGVTWWNSDFVHTAKKHRFGKDTVVDIEPNYSIRFIHGPGYTKHVSLKRFWDHRLTGKRFFQWALQEEPPDIVLTALPTLDLASAAVRYGKTKNVPVVVDIRDLWPDVMVEKIPGFLQWTAPIALAHYYAMAKYVCRNTVAITGNTPDFVEWGLKKTNRKRNEFDRYFPFGYQEPVLPEEKIKELDEFWKGQGLVESNSTGTGKVSVVTFIGSIAQSFQDEVIIGAATEVLKKYDVRFVICGDGDRLEEVRQRYKEIKQVIFPGWVNAEQIWRLMEHTDIGLVAYKDSKNLRSSLTNKMIEYMAGGLPVLFSIDDGYVADLVRKNEIGLTYGGSSERLATEIVKLIENETLRNQYASNSRSFYEKNFKAEEVYSSFVEYLEKIAEKYK